MHTYKGFLFGHYDSRGGANFIETDDEYDAKRKYQEMTGQTLQEQVDEMRSWANDPNTHPDFIEFRDKLNAAGDDERKLLDILLEEDFLGSVTVESCRELEHGEDIEYGNADRVEQEPANAEKARAFEDGLQWAGEEIVETTANPYQELLWWNEKDRILRLLPPGWNPREGWKKEWGGSSSYSRWPKPPVDENWKRSSFGEDACGIIFNSRAGYEA